MTENGELSNVKALLRGLLISSTKAMTIDALKRDFKQEEGRDIPFLQLGYPSLNAFLKSIPDTLKLVDDPYNRITTVIPVKNEKTAHIDALVMKQRVVIPKRRNGYCAPVVRRRQEALSTPIVDRKLFDQPRVDRTFNFSTASRPFSNDQYYSHQHHSQQATPYSQSYVQPARFYNQPSPHSHKPPLLPHIPPLLPHIPPLLSHLPSPQFGLLPSQSHRPYQSKLPSQSPLPSQSNLPSQSHLPSPSKSQSQQQSHSHTSITHKPNCESNGLDAEKNFKNSIPLCEEDYAPSHDLGSNLSRGKEEQYLNIVPAGGEDFDEIEETTNTLEETLQFDEESRHESASKGFWEINSSTPIKTNGNHKTDYPNFTKNDVPHWPQSNGYDSISSPRESECDSTAIVYSDLVSKKLQDNFRILLSDNPDGIWASELRRKYLKRFSSELDYFSYGFSSVTQLCLSLPEIFRYLKLDGINYKLFDFRKPIPKSALNQDYYMNKLKTPGIPSRIKFNLSHLVEKFPDGLHYLKLGEIYEELYGQAVDYSEIGFDTLEDLLLTVSESIVQIHYINNEMFVYPGKKNSDYDDPPPILPKQGIEHILDLYPPESINVNHTIPKQQLPSDLKPDDTLNIEILEVYTPTKFYFNIFSNECSQALDTLMEAMQNFYRTTTSKKLCMLPETVVEGHFCVAPYQLTDDVIEWTRAKINKIMSDTEVKVFFVDHGSTSLVNMKDLRYIHKDFADLPLQALLGKMSGIGPPHGQNNWPVEASKTFIKLLDSRPVVATVVEVNHKARSISALLVDTSSREDVVINQELVQLGLASVLPSLVNKVNQVEIEAKESARGDQQLEESQICEDTTMYDDWMSVCSNRSHTFYGNHSSPSTASGEWSPDLQDGNYGHSVAQSRPSLYNEYYLPPMLEQPSTTSLSYNLNETESFNSPPSPRYQHNPPPGFTIPQKHNIPILSNSPSPAPPNVSSPLRLSGHQMNQPFISNSLSQSNIQPPYSHQHIPSEVQLFMQAAAAAAVLEQRQRFDQQMMYDQQMRQQVLQTYLPYLYSQSISTPSIPFADFSMMNTLFDPTVMTTALNMPTTPMPSSVVNISEVPASPPSSPMPNTRAALTTSPPPDDSCVPSAARMDQIKPVDKVNSDAAIQVGSGISETPVFVETTKLKHDEDSKFELKKTQNDLSSNESAAKLSDTTGNPVLNELLNELNRIQISVITQPESPTDVIKLQEETLTNMPQEYVCKEQPAQHTPQSHVEVPLSSNISESSNEVVPHPTNDSSQTIKSLQPTSLPQEPHNIEIISIGGLESHLLNLGHIPYICTAELVTQYTSFTGYNVLIKILESKSIPIAFIELNRARYMQHFQELESLNVPGLKRSKTGHIVGKVHLTPLRSVPNILTVIKADKENIMSDLKKLINSFNPDDIYWTGSV